MANFPFLRSHLVPSLLFVVLCLGVAQSFSFHLSCLRAASNPEAPRLYGGDFNIFYIAGAIAILNPEQVYEPNIIQARQKQFLESIGEKHALRQVYAFPPFVTPLFSALSRLPYLQSALVWQAINISCVLLALLILAHEFRFSERVTLVCVISIFGFTPFSMSSLGLGQIGGVLLLIFSVTAIGINRHQSVLSGVALAAGMLKPPLFVALGIALILTRRASSVVLVTICCILVLAGLSLALVGLNGLDMLLAIWLSYRSGAVLPDGRVFIHNNGVGLLAFLNSVFASSKYLIWGLYFLLCIPILAGVRSVIRCLFVSEPASPLLFGALVGGAVILSPHVMTYDLTVFLLPLWLLLYEGDSKVGKRPISHTFALALLFISLVPLPENAINEVNYRAALFTVWVIALLLFVLRNERVMSINS